MSIANVVFSAAASFLADLLQILAARITAFLTWIEQNLLQILAAQITAFITWIEQNLPQILSFLSAIGA